MFTTKKTKNAEAAIKKGHNAHSIGLSGTVEDFNIELEKFQEHTATIKKAFRRADNIDVVIPIGAPKWQRLRSASGAAAEIPDDMRREFVRGARDALKAGRPHNIQYIFSHPSEFMERYQTETSFSINTLLNVLNDSASPDTAVTVALADTLADRAQEILDRTLTTTLYSRIDENIVRQVSALLKAGADPDYNSNESLAIALHRDAPANLVEMLLNNSKNTALTNALQKMRNDRDTYGDTPEKIEARQQTARIQELEEAVKELTRRLDESGITSTVPAEQAGPGKKIVKLIKPSGSQ